MKTTNNNEPAAELGAGGIAGFSSRLMALTIDLALLFFFSAMLLVCTGRDVVGLADGEVDIMMLFQAAGNWLTWLLVCGLGAGAAYFCLMHAWCGKTIGKHIMGIRLVTSDGGRANLGLCFLRLIGYGISAGPLFFGFLWALLDIEGRTWHDRLAGTKVIYG